MSEQVAVPVEAEAVQPVEQEAQPVAPQLSQVGSKYLLVGLSSAGKSMALIKLKDAFVFYADTKKRFPLNMPHANIYSYREFVSKVNGKTVNALPDKAIEYTGMQPFQDAMINKLLAYHGVNGRLPATIAFDAVTNIYKMIADHIRITTKNVYGSQAVDIAKAMDEFLAWVERELVGRGINVVFLAHAVIEPETGQPIIAATGSKTFDSTGGILGAFNYASYLHVKDGIRLIAHKDLAFPRACRSMLPDVLDDEDAEGFDAQAMIDDIRAFENKQEAMVY